MEGQEASHFWVCKQLQKPDQKEVKKKKWDLPRKWHLSKLDLLEQL
jgi:hypothetical protein